MAALSIGARNIKDPRWTRLKLALSLQCRMPASEVEERIQALAR